MTRRLLLYALPVLLLAGCGSTEPPPDPDTAIVTVDRGAGLAPAADEWKLPDFTLFGDGTAVVRGRTSGVVLTGVRRTVPAGQIAELYRKADDAGLFDNKVYDLGIQDGAVLTVRIADEKGTYETTVVGPDEDDGGDRGDVLAFAEAAVTAGSDAGEYRPERYAVVVPARSDGAGEARPWPLSVPLARFEGAPSRPCHILTRAEAEPMLAAVSDATPDTRWDAQGQRVALLIRPLLPGEQVCGDL